MHRILVPLCLALAAGRVTADHHDTILETPGSGIAPRTPVITVLHSLVGRQEGQRCGPAHGSCTEGSCCSSAGFCGRTFSHCGWPACQAAYGRCDPPVLPEGPSTENIPRPKLSVIPYGPVVIRTCTVPGTVALTFDDGPNIYTNDLLDVLDRHNATATFFITGNEMAKPHAKGPMEKEPWAPIIERMYKSGHQIASHSWSHLDLSGLTKEQRRFQMVWNEIALRNILGGFPAYMRPPFASCTAESGCLKEMGDLGYHIILYDLDTEDYRYDNPATIHKSKEIFDKEMDRVKSRERPWLVIAHDVHEQTSHNLTEHMLLRLKAEGHRAVTVGECLGDPKEFWYRRDNRFQDRPLFKEQVSKQPQWVPAVSRDGQCGGGFTCDGSKFGPCCAINKRCGSTMRECGAGCKPGYGKCAVNKVPTGREGQGPGVLPPALAPSSEGVTLKAAFCPAGLVGLFMMAAF